jgi:Tfp pilus assembly protein PilV
MNSGRILRQRGGVILEALIAFLVLGGGVVAVLYLQGNLMEGNSNSKARAEAMELGKEHIESLRNYIEKEQFENALTLAAADARSNNPIQGINANYTVTYSYDATPEDENQDLTEVTEEPVKLSSTVPQQIMVTVEWDSSKSDDTGSPIRENVVLSTVLYYSKPELATLRDDQEEGDSVDPSDFPLPSPWLTGYEGEHESTESLKPEGSEDWMTPVDLPPRMIMELDETGGISFKEEIVTLKTYTAPPDSPNAGRTNVEVIYDGNVELTSFGGIVHQISGEIILHPDSQTTLTDVNRSLEVLASPPSFCMFPICDEAEETSTDLPCEKPNGAKYVSYTCFVPGDCTDGDPYSVGCPDPFAPPPDKDLNGGWYGRVGNFNIALKPDDMVCVADTRLGSNPDDSNLTPSREYVTHRWEYFDDPTDEPDLGETIPNIAGNEGINRSFNCQSFIIAKRKTGEGACLELAKEYPDYDPTTSFDPVAPTGTLWLPHENMIRWVDENGASPEEPPFLIRPTTEKNYVLPVYEEFCGASPLPEI